MGTDDIIRVAKIKGRFILSKAAIEIRVTENGMTNIWVYLAGHGFGRILMKSLEIEQIVVKTFLVQLGLSYFYFAVM